MQKRALITGISGQDGSYLAEYLLEQGYEVHGIVKSDVTEYPRQNLQHIFHIAQNIVLHSGPVENYAQLRQVVGSVQPTEFYHLAAQSHVVDSFEDAFDTLNVNIIGTLSGLAAVRELAPGCRYYYAASSEMFGKTEDSPQSETTPFHPRSPYGISKVTGFNLTRNYREIYKVYAVSGILFNHESPRRGYKFVTRKISLGAAKIKMGLADHLLLGNLDARRDWGHSRDYVKQMHAMLQLDTPEDFVIATGETHSVREFCELAFAELGLDYQKFVRVNPQLLRADDTGVLVGDASKAHQKLGWQPCVKFEELVREMVRADYELLKQGKQFTTAFNC